MKIVRYQEEEDKSREKFYTGLRVLKMEVQNERTSGRPKQRWMDCVRDDLLRENQQSGDVYYWAKRRQVVRNINPHIEWEKIYID